VREWIRHCDRRFIPEAKRVFANSKTVAARLRHYNQIESEPLYHPPPRFEQLRNGEQGDYIFYPSRLEPQKRQELLIEAMKFAQTPVNAVLAGRSANLKHYQSLIKQHGVSERVKLLGFVSEPEMIELYANALGVCYLPFDEDYGYVTLEGMLAGKPVVVPSDGGGATEFVEHDQDGFVVEAGPRAIAKSLDALYLDRERARKMGLRGQEKLQAMNLSWQNVVERLISAA
jgi:glycosyltransferase involved in cell wall biosynthesis